MPIYFVIVYVLADKIYFTIFEGTPIGWLGKGWNILPHQQGELSVDEISTIWDWGVVAFGKHSDKEWCIPEQKIGFQELRNEVQKCCEKLHSNRADWTWKYHL